MSYREVFECDNCGRAIESALYFERDGAWKNTAYDGPPQEDESILCLVCARRSGVAASG